MRKLSFGGPPRDLDGKIDWIIRALRTIETATHEIEPYEIADGFTVANYDPSTTQLRTLDLDVGTQTTDAMVTALMYVVGTFLSDLKRRGAKRT